MGKSKKRWIELKELNRKNDAILRVYSQWMRLPSEKLYEWFRNHDFYKIAVYGMHYLGESLCDKLNNTDIKVMYAIDRNAYKIYADIAIYTPDEKLEEVDAVIVTAFFYYNDIKEQLSRFLQCPIISFEYVLKEIMFKKCICCGNQVLYKPIQSSHIKNKKKYNVEIHILETMNQKEYFCPYCGANDRDRMIVAFMQRLGLDRNCHKELLLQFAPSEGIDYWIKKNCFSLTYHTTDLYVKEVTFTSDIQDMVQIEDEKYDYIVCSHVLEHVQDDRKAMRELYRILKNDGLCMFLVPISLDLDRIDEEWELSEEENWKRFGQGDHCRRYAKQELIERLKETGFFVYCLGKSYFGEYIYRENALIDTSTLYVLTKEDGGIENLVVEKWEKHNL